MVLIIKTDFRRRKMDAVRVFDSNVRHLPVLVVTLDVALSTRALPYLRTSVIIFKMNIRVVAVTLTVGRKCLLNRACAHNRGLCCGMITAES